MAKKLYEESNIQAIADAIRGKNGLTDTYKTSEMAAAITAIESGGGADLPEEALNITGDCSYRFAYAGWDWFIKHYGSRVTTKNIESALSMFINSNAEEIQFEINFTSDNTCDISSLLSGCKELKSVPVINNCRPSKMSSLFAACMDLRYIPDDIGDWFDWSYIETATSTSTGSQSSMFQYCHSLRKVPTSILSHGNPNIRNNYSYFNQGFQNCYSLDELVNTPLPYTAVWSSNAFSLTFNSCQRLKNLTFAMPDGAPYVRQWKTQTIDLSNEVGYAKYPLYIINGNSGITEDKEVKDDATYQALKNDPDWYASKIEYSRYNHDSAVATINSLPDTSAYLATAGGTNTIKFDGDAGSATDGGAINTLTEEEIAIATARGWTVSFV